MATYKSTLNAIARTARQEQQQRERLAKQRARLAKQAEREKQQMMKAKEKEKAQRYTESRIDEVDTRNEELATELAELENLLQRTLSVDDYIDLEKLKKPIPAAKAFYAGSLGIPSERPALEAPKIEKPSGLSRLIPGSLSKYEKALEEAKRRDVKRLAEYDEQERERLKKVDEARKLFEDQARALKEEVEKHNAGIDEFITDFRAAKPEAIVSYCTMVLEASDYPDNFPQTAKVAYVPESKQLVVEYDLPPFDVMPTVSVYKYVKTKDEITETALPATKRRSLYNSVIAQTTLRTIHELFEADRLNYVESVVFNGHVLSIDRGTGRDVHPCIVTVRTTRDVFLELDLKRVDPIACLKKLSATVSSSPDELAPVKPVLEFTMVDKRFIDEVDVISTLDTRTNLMDLKPAEFEALISNLFSKMGLESKLTRSSKDGGVDCVAFDPRPILGGKVVIQAKRYKNTVGVSAVRDLFGTMHNEGASKGILVTTSGFGKSSFEFAEDKPVELISGSNLLYLLSVHAGIEARIEVPEDWKEPTADSGE